MKALNFSPASLFHFQQLATMVKQKTGIRHSMSDPTDALHLLRYCCRCEDAKISEAYYQFSGELEQQQRDYLTSYGLLTSDSLSASVPAGTSIRTSFSIPTSLYRTAENRPISVQ
jgi:hypothetical protein